MSASRFGFRQRLGSLLLRCAVVPPPSTEQHVLAALSRLMNARWMGAEKDRLGPHAGSLVAAMQSVVRAHPASLTPQALQHFELVSHDSVVDSRQEGVRAVKLLQAIAALPDGASHVTHVANTDAWVMLSAQFRVSLKPSWSAVHVNRCARLLLRALQRGQDRGRVRAAHAELTASLFDYAEARSVIVKNGAAGAMLNAEGELPALIDVASRVASDGGKGRQLELPDKAVALLHRLLAALSAAPDVSPRVCRQVLRAVHFGGLKSGVAFEALRPMLQNGWPVERRQGAVGEDTALQGLRPSHGEKPIEEDATIAILFAARSCAHRAVPLPTLVDIALARCVAQCLPDEARGPLLEILRSASAFDEEVRVALASSLASMTQTPADVRIHLRRVLLLLLELNAVTAACRPHATARLHGSPATSAVLVLWAETLLRGALGVKRHGPTTWRGFAGVVKAVTEASCGDVPPGLAVSLVQVAERLLSSPSTFNDRQGFRGRAVKWLSTAIHDGGLRHKLQSLVLRCCVEDTKSAEEAMELLMAAGPSVLFLTASVRGCDGADALRSALQRGVSEGGFALNMSIVAASSLLSKADNTAESLRVVVAPVLDDLSNALVAVGPHTLTYRRAAKLVARVSSAHLHFVHRDDEEGAKRILEGVARSESFAMLLRYRHWHTEPVEVQRDIATMLAHEAPRRVWEYFVDRAAGTPTDLMTQAASPGTPHRAAIRSEDMRDSDLLA